MERNETFLSKFTTMKEKMISTNVTHQINSTWDDWHTDKLLVNDYTPEEIQHIIERGSLEERRDLSCATFNTNSIYKRLIMYYATFLKYTGLLTPNPAFGQSLSKPFIQKRYYNALTFVDSLHLSTLMESLFEKALKNGAYYGVFSEVNNAATVLDLPNKYCKTRFKTPDGIDIIEFNLEYFSSFPKLERKIIVDTYPAEIAAAYENFVNDEGKQWFLVPSEIGVFFSFSENQSPLFLDTIYAILQYNKAVDTDQERNLEEIRKIVVQKVPHLTDGSLLFEPDEAQEMHDGAVGMLKGNKNISVLTTYADVDSITSKTSADANNNGIDEMYQNVYNNAGSSAELFAATGSSTLPYSIKCDLALTMSVARKFDYMLTKLINSKFANANIVFTYTTLPVSYYNEKEYIEETFKLAQSGYSFLLPALGSGLSQQQFINIKKMENDVLGLSDLMKPLKSAYTQSGGGTNAKEDTQKSEKTIANEKSLDNNVGGSN